MQILTIVQRAMGLVITSAETGTLLVDTLTVPINNSAAATSLEALNDVDVGTAAGQKARETGDILVYDGTVPAWVNRALDTSGNIDEY